MSDTLLEKAAYFDVAPVSPPTAAIPFSPSLFARRCRHHYLPSLLRAPCFVHIAMFMPQDFRARRKERHAGVDIARMSGCAPQRLFDMLPPLPLQLYGGAQDASRRHMA